MTPIEKAENALNTRIERLQASLRAADSETARQFLFQALLVSIGIGEALTNYVRSIGQFAQGRHGELRAAHDTLTAQHADLLNTGRELLGRLKANPTDKAILKEIERAQKDMAAIQKNLKRGANTLQRDLAPSMAMIDELAGSVRRLAEADQIDALKRVIKTIVGHVRELYQSQPTLPAKKIIDAAAWEESALSAIDEATDLYEAYARAGNQVMLAIDVMTMAVSASPPHTAEEATQRANETVSARLKEITTRLTTSRGNLDG